MKRAIEIFPKYISKVLCNLKQSKQIHFMIEWEGIDSLIHCKSKSSDLVRTLKDPNNDNQ